MLRLQNQSIWASHWLQMTNELPGKIQMEHLSIDCMMLDTCLRKYNSIAKTVRIPCHFVAIVLNSYAAPNVDIIEFNQSFILHSLIFIFIIVINSIDLIISRFTKKIWFIRNGITLQKRDGNHYHSSTTLGHNTFYQTKKN